MDEDKTGRDDFRALQDEPDLDPWSGSASPVTPVPPSPLTALGNGAADYLLYFRRAQSTSAVSVTSSTETLVDEDKDSSSDPWQAPLRAIVSAKSAAAAATKTDSGMSSPPAWYTRHKRWAWRRNRRIAVPFALLAFAIGFVVVCAVAFMAPTNCSEYPCERPFQHQSYLDFPDFNTSRLSEKYDLHLYRDELWGISNGNHLPVRNGFSPTGVPVVFVPGNAGSFRQVRHIAAECTRQYEKAFGSQLASTDNRAPLDMYSLDFGEDLTAFHGQALLDQAEYLNDAISYILSLYKDQPDPPKSVILLGHSMGGVVARTVFMMPNYIQDSVQAIMTFAAPHTAPPATFDADIVRAYDKVNEFWRQAFSREFSRSSSVLSRVSLISMAGGHLDQMIPSNHAGVSSLVPPTNGFAVLTNSIPGVWSGIGHEAILWCDPLRKAIAAGLLDIIDTKSPHKVLPLEDRMSVFRRRFLTGLEERAMQRVVEDHMLAQPLSPPTRHASSHGQFMHDIPHATLGTSLVPNSLLTYGETSALMITTNDAKFDIFNVSQWGWPMRSKHQNTVATYLLPIGEKTHMASSMLSLLSEAPLLDGSFDPYQDVSEFDGYYVLACRFPVSQWGDKDLGQLDQVDVSAAVGIRFGAGRFSTQSYRNLVCHNLARYAVELPRLAPRPAEPLDALSQDGVAHIHGGNDPLMEGPLTDLRCMRSPAPAACGGSSYWYLGVNATRYLQGYDYLAVVDATGDTAPKKRLVAEVLDDSARSHISVSGSGMWKMWLGKEKRVKLPANRPIKMDISFPSVWSSLLAYRLRVVKGKGVSALSATNMSIPVISQSIEDPHESKFYLNAKPGTLMPVNIHGVAPFTPYSLRHDDETYHSLRVQVWSEQSYDLPVDIVLELDTVRSLGKLVLHYRTALAVMPMFVVMIVLLLQIWNYNVSGYFPSFGDALVVLSTRYLVLLLAIVAMVPYIASIPMLNRLLYVIEPWMDMGSGEGRLVRRVGFFLGLEPSHLVWLGPLFTLVSLGMVELTYSLVLLVIRPISRAVRVFNRRKLRRYHHRPPKLNAWRVFALAIGLVVISYIVPYQPAFMLVFVIQVFACIRALSKYQSVCDLARADDSASPTSSDGGSTTEGSTSGKQASGRVSLTEKLDTWTAAAPPTVTQGYKQTKHDADISSHYHRVTDDSYLSTMITRSRNHYRFAVSLMVVYIWLLPINLAFLAVWVHNVRVNWVMSFSSQHNLFSITPMVAVTELCLSGKMLPRIYPSMSSRSLLTIGMLGYMGSYCLLFGIQRAYWLHQLVNLFCAWLLVLYCEAEASALYKALRLPGFLDVASYS